jgi:autophagy-related protein 11
MDVPVPTIDFSPSGSNDSFYSLERDDVDGKHFVIYPLLFVSPLWMSGLLRVLDDLAQSARSRNDLPALTAIEESRTSLEKLISRMDSLESSFDRIAERSC